MSQANITRQRILEGAVRAVARHGISKLGMSDVSENAGVSRGTLYRYFPTRDELLRALGGHELARFLERVIHSVNDLPDGADRLRVLLEVAVAYLHEHAALQRLLESDPAFVLDSLRDLFPTMKSELRRLLAPYLTELGPVRDGHVSGDQIVDWMTRFLISMYLFEDKEPEKMTRSMTALYQVLTAQWTPSTGAQITKEITDGKPDQSR